MVAQQAVGALVLLDPAVSDLVEDGHESGGACGAGGINFEEFVIFRSFAAAACLEEQVRFLWAIFDPEKTCERSCWCRERCSAGTCRTQSYGRISYLQRCVARKGPIVVLFFKVQAMSRARSRGEGNVPFHCAILSSADQNLAAFNFVIRAVARFGFFGPTEASISSCALKLPT